MARLRSWRNTSQSRFVWPFTGASGWGNSKWDRIYQTDHKFWCRSI